VDPRLDREAGEPPVGLPAHAHTAAAPADPFVTREKFNGGSGEFLVMAAVSSGCTTADSEFAAS
jgi:hypothetical protein